jgi:flagellar hook assembly protein FlgD
MNISVYNLLGQRVKTLLNKNMETGTYTLKWNGRDDTGSMLPSGMYFYELKSPLFTSVKKLVLVR